MTVTVQCMLLSTDTMSMYGNYYLKRAITAMIGLGAHQPEDAVYPMNLGDADGKPMDGASKYVLHFATSSRRWGALNFI